MSTAILALSLPMLAGSGYSLYRGIRSLIEAFKNSDVLADLPLRSSAAIDIPAAGECVLSLRGRFGSRDFAGASYRLMGAGGIEVPSSLIVMRAMRTSFDGSVTLSVRRFRVGAPGRYELQVAGIEGRAPGRETRLLLGKTAGTRLLMPVLQVVVSGVLVLACLVMTLMLAFA